MQMFKIARSGNTIFDLTGKEVMDALSAGTVLPTDHYWTQGMTGWELVSGLNTGSGRTFEELNQNGMKSLVFGSGIVRVRPDPLG
jgi:hypothetical protein